MALYGLHADDPATGVLHRQVGLVDGVARITGKVQAGYVYVDGSSVGAVTEASLKDRRILGDEGFVSIFVAVSADTGQVVTGPVITARGFGLDDAGLEQAKPLILDALAAAAAEGIGDTHQLQQLVRRAVGRWVSQTTRRRPMILPVVVEV